MSLSQPVAFYAPLKSPNHPLPSGDRTMARLLMKALHRAGFSPSLASELRTLDKTGDRDVQESTRQQSLAEAERLIAHYRSLPEENRPRLWFTYHVYYKAPDWIGPRVSQALGIPYAIAEGSRAAKRAHGPWALGHEAAEAALDQADAIFVMTAKDRIGLEAAKPARQVLFDLPPFIDDGEWPALSSPRGNGTPHLLTVAMMRHGDKLASYRILADAMKKIEPLSWSLDIVGDGEAFDEIKGLFAPFNQRVTFHGRIDDKARLAVLYEKADLFIWPAVNEAYGMVLLEAQLFGCPVVAGAYGGVASVVRQDETGLLTMPGDADAFAEALRALLAAPERRHVFGAAARNFVKDERNLENAALRLRNAFASLGLKQGS